MYISAITIGRDSNTCDGNDEYLLVTTKDGEASEGEVHCFVEDNYFYPPHACGRFCNSMTIMSSMKDLNKHIVILHHRYDN